MKKKSDKTGFTVLELLTVVAVLGILTVLMFSKFVDLFDKAKEGKTKGSLGAIRSTLSIYYAGNQQQKPNLLSGLVTEYIARIPKGEIPFVDSDADGTKDESYSWNDNAEGIAADFDLAGTTDKSSLGGWAYDSDRLEAWVELDSGSLDTKGNMIYQW